MIDESGQSSGFGVVTQPEDTITAIKKALEELREKIGHAYDSGYNRLGQLSDWCADLDAMRPTLESLQRENEELRADNDRLAKEAGYIGAALSSTGDTHGN